MLDEQEDLLAKLDLRRPDTRNTNVLKEFETTLRTRFEAAVEIREYFRALEQLEATRRLEEVAQAKRELSELVNVNSRDRWQQWLRLQPSRLSAADRQALSCRADMNNDLLCLG